MIITRLYSFFFFFPGTGHTVYSVQGIFIRKKKVNEEKLMIPFAVAAEKDNRGSDMEQEHEHEHVASPSCSSLIIDFHLFSYKELDSQV